MLILVLTSGQYRFSLNVHYHRWRRLLSSPFDRGPIVIQRTHYSPTILPLRSSRNEIMNDLTLLRDSNFFLIGILRIICVWDFYRTPAT